MLGAVTIEGFDAKNRFVLRDLLIILFGAGAGLGMVNAPIASAVAARMEGERKGGGTAGGAGGGGGLCRDKIFIL